MTRFILFFVFWCIVLSTTYGQYTVFKDDKGQVLTTYDTYSTRSDVALHNQVTYLGSPFLTYPVWQKGKIKVDKYGKILDCELAYNLVNGNILCRFAGDSTFKLITPEAFTINNTTFVRQQNQFLGIDYNLYATVLRDGPTKLLMSLSSILERNISGDGYAKEIQGIFQTKAKYYIRKREAQPELITLTKKSVLAALYDQSEKLAVRLSDKQLTTNDVINILAYYDELVATAKTNNTPLRYDPVFAQGLHDKITYPSAAWNEGIYGRVYAGFEVNEQGIIKNIVILSPENVGFGLADEVKKALEKLPALSLVYGGKYALPVAFTYTNRKDKAGPHVPINRLPSERLEGRTLLDEFIVPSDVSKPVIITREVWGYYK